MDAQFGVRFEVLTTASMKMTVFWVVAPCIVVLAASIIRAIPLMMEAASISVTLVNFYQIIRRNNPEGSHLRTIWKFVCPSVYFISETTVRITIKFRAEDGGSRFYRKLVFTYNSRRFTIQETNIDKHNIISISLKWTLKKCVTE
jgi:hypothetical protein